MRYIIKGGVWKNVEDEILKAAVMKYGLNQWSRISSLLIRKSAKQCKQRWYEWLDPQIKKTEWTREEDEKLLHLAKIFPCQWRTIAPLVNRTPNQCVERYERLLDIAQGKDPDDPNDPRKLKPGEIDPNPETKPAKVDQIDMDEDQKEMLAEARVRLANTMGKKPKRLAREKLIEDARRQAQLQKRTELKAAGIEILGKRRQKGTDYNQEIPFERVPQQKIYKVDNTETPKPNLSFQNLSLRDIVGQQRVEEEEAKRKHEEKAKKKLMEKDLSQVVDKMAKQTRDILMQRTQLVMPEVQLSDKDLELLGKQNAFSSNVGTDNEVTKGLMGNYTSMMTPTPMRTPRIIQDTVMTEAKNLVALNNTQTPLLGGQNAELIDPNRAFSTTANPTFKVPQTPNQFKKMLETASQNQIFAQPASKKRQQQIPQTPLKDEFNLNDKNRAPYMELENNSSWEYSQSQLTDDTQFIPRSNQEYLKMALQNIPKPQYEYEIEIPDLEDEEDQERMKQIDAREEEILKQKQQQQEREKQQRMKSLAIKKKLPRPFQIPNQLYDHIYNRQDLNDYRKEAEQMLESETIQLLTFDMQNFPFAGCKPVNTRISLENFEENEILKASQLVNSEIDQIKKELKVESVDSEFITSKYKDSEISIQYNRQQNQLVNVKQNKEAFKEILKQQAERNKLIMQRDQKKLDQFLLHKARTNLTGYVNIIQKNAKEIDELISTQLNLKIELDVFKKLQEQEKQSSIYRIEEQKNYYDQLVSKEKELQEKYDRFELLRYQIINEQKNETIDDEEEDNKKQNSDEDDIYLSNNRSYNYYNQNVIIEEINLFQ
ncbi:Myb-like DNA-binding domain protein (macronuclear) [Tetrahymena thermophila SB210]|uniref:Myb-like DNA-binding domain protein n=1 Tax=Tetrahymena thermophila (strain SB210) TaxID=312017 RepID=W7X3L6_TETTS|nr:Myb-like DNA-binding domain protein [Tetrahymena thermophila SB210]EWS71013.1 Myb-like DNA-binding domain protein [Tetrahymena thermophila SB210]|eukprot:XP_012656454.1 Myb-like DNA-binding domain protein [Tetrahymena thermophila SB210]